MGQLCSPGFWLHDRGVLFRYSGVSISCNCLNCSFRWQVRCLHASPHSERWPSDHRTGIPSSWRYYLWPKTGKSGVGVPVIPFGFDLVPGAVLNLRWTKYFVAVTKYLFEYVFSQECLYLHSIFLVLWQAGTVLSCFLLTWDSRENAICRTEFFLCLERCFCAHPPLGGSRVVAQLHLVLDWLVHPFQIVSYLEWVLSQV